MLKAEILEKANRKPDLMIPNWLSKRWSQHTRLIEFTGRSLLTRQDAGLWAFNDNFEFSRKSLAAWRDTSFFQAMNPASFELLNFWKNSSTQDELTHLRNVWDFCAAPGGKLLGILTLLKKQGISPNTLATELKWNRAERLKENFKRSSLPMPRIECVDVLEFDPDQKTWDLLILDLPCSGSGTFATRPDLLYKTEDVLFSNSIFDLQNRIVKKALSLNTKSLVSVCSIDPEETARIEELLKTKKYLQFDSTSGADFSDTYKGAHLEGLRAWIH